MARARRMLALTVLVVLLCYVAIVAAVWWKQDALVYFPSPDVPEATAARVKNVEDVWLPGLDGAKIHGWWVETRTATPAAVVVFFHGNGGNIADRSWRLEKLAVAGYDSLIVDWPGYGRSGGAPSETGLYAAGRVAAECALARAAGRPVIYWGESLGCAVAIETALAHPPAGLILEAPFTSMPAVGAFHYPWLPVARLSRARYDNLGKIGRIRTKLLVIHGERDRTIPFAHGRAVFEAANEPKRFVAVAEADHNETTWYDFAPIEGALRWMAAR